MTTDREIAAARIAVHEAEARLHVLLAAQHRQRLRDANVQPLLTAAHGRAFHDPEWIRWLRAMGHPADEHWPEAMTLAQAEFSAEVKAPEWKEAARLLRDYLAA